MKPHKITELYAWICTDASGEDGIPATWPDATGMVMPLIGSDKERIESLRAMALSITTTRGFPVRLCKFSQMEVLETMPAPSVATEGRA